MAVSPKKRAATGVIFGLIGAAGSLVAVTSFLVVLKRDVEELQGDKPFEKARDAAVADIREAGEGERSSIKEIRVQPGTVMAFAGEASVIEGGWVLCDGRSYEGSKKEYAALYKVIGTAYGNDEKKEGWFNVPDYRGLFLRGVDDPDGEGGRDPARKDVDSRDRTRADGREGPVVGSTQGHQMQAHTHEELGKGHQHGARGTTIRVNGRGDAGVQGTSGPDDADLRRVRLGGPAAIKDGDEAPKSGAETRPANVYVNWVIKL